MKPNIGDGHEDKKGRSLESEKGETWRMFVSEAGETPLQENRDDCGVSVCTMLEMSSARWTCKFTEAHMPQLRRRLALQVIQCRVDGEVWKF